MLNTRSTTLKPLVRLLPAIFACMTASACSDTGMTVLDVNGTGSSVRQTRTQLDFASGQSQVGQVNSVLPAPLGVKVTDQDGNPLVGVTVYWSFANGGGATDPAGAAASSVTTTTDNSGVARAYWLLGTQAGSQGATAGLSSNTNKGNGKGNGSLAFTAQATPGDPANVVVTPGSVTVSSGKDTTFTADVSDTWNNPIANPPLSWSVSPSAVATVNGKGRVSTVSPGSATVKATAGTATGTASISVTGMTSPTVSQLTASPSSLSLDALGAIAQISATATDSQGASVTADLQWQSVDPGIATVDASGKVTALANGTTDIIVSAACCTVSDTVAVSVAQVAQTVTLSSSLLSLPVGGADSLVALVKDANGYLMSNASLAWSSNATTVATVNSVGVVSAVAQGSASITAKSGTASGSASVSVTGTTTQPAQGLLFSDGFESGDLSHTANDARWTSNNRTIVSSAIAHSGTHSLRFHYQAAADGSDSDAEQRFSLGRNVTEVWVEFYIYYPDGTEGVGPRFVHRTESTNGNNDKFIRIWGDDYNAHNKVGASTWPETNGDERLGFEYGKLQQPIGQYNSGYVDPYVTDSTRGRWLQIRYHAKMATDSTSYDGAIDIWVDGVKYSAVDNKGNPGLNIYDNSSPYWNTGYLLGWANSGFTQDTYVYVDDVEFYDANPGW